MDQEATGASGGDTVDLGLGTPDQSMDCRTYVVITVGGSDTMQGLALYAAGTQVGISERGAINDKGYLQELLGMHQRGQG